MAMQWEPRTSSEPLYGSFVDADMQPRDVAHTRAEEARSSRRCAEAEEEGDDDAGAVATLGGGEIGAPPSRRRRTGPLLFVAGALFAGAVFALSGSRGTTRAADADGAVEEDNALSRAAAALWHAAAGVGHAFGGSSHGVGHPRGKPTTLSPTPRPPPTQSPSISMSPTAAPPSPAPTAAMPTPSPSHAIAPLPTRKGLHPAPTTPHRTGSPTRTPVDDSVALVPLRLYKRTFVSTHARNDERFFERVLGIATVHNYTYHAGYNRWRTSADGIENGEDGSGKWTCAQRIEMSALAYQVHLFESFTTPTGFISTATWVNYWRELHSNFEAGWDQFMANSQTFYTSDLTAHATRVAEDGIPCLQTQYVNPLDGVTLYSLIVEVPNTAHLVEIVSETLDSSLQNGFGEWDDDACARSNYVDYTAEEMKWRWDFLRATDDNAEGLPELMIVKVSYPATRVEDLSDFFRRFDAGAPVSYGASADFVDDAYNASAHDASTPPAEKCEWSTVRVKIGETSGTANLDVDIRAVSNPAARVGALTVAMWAGYVKELHARMTGEFEGWDRYLDNHIGLFVEAGATLDDYVDPLFQMGIPGRAHVGHVGDVEGSIWTGGIDAQGIELHGNFSSSWAAELDELEYCSPDSSRAAANPTPAPRPVSAPAKPSVVREHTTAPSASPAVVNKKHKASRGGGKNSSAAADDDDGDDATATTTAAATKTTATLGVTAETAKAAAAAEAVVAGWREERATAAAATVTPAATTAAALSYSYDVSSMQRAGDTTSGASSSSNERADGDSGGGSAEDAQARSASGSTGGGGKAPGGDDDITFDDATGDGGDGVTVGEDDRWDAPAFDDDGDAPPSTLMTTAPSYAPSATPSYALSAAPSYAPSVIKHATPHPTIMETPVPTLTSASDRKAERTSSSNSSSSTNLSSLTNVSSTSNSSWSTTNSSSSSTTNVSTNASLNATSSSVNASTQCGVHCVSSTSSHTHSHTHTHTLTDDKSVDTTNATSSANGKIAHKAPDGADAALDDEEGAPIMSLEQLVAGVALDADDDAAALLPLLAADDGNASSAELDPLGAADDAVGAANNASAALDPLDAAGGDGADNASAALDPLGAAGSGDESGGQDVDPLDAGGSGSGEDVGPLDAGGSGEDTEDVVGPAADDTVADDEAASSAAETAQDRRHRGANATTTTATTTTTASASLAHGSDNATTTTATTTATTTTTTSGGGGGASPPSVTGGSAPTTEAARAQTATTEERHIVDDDPGAGVATAFGGTEGAGDLEESTGDDDSPCRTSADCGEGYSCDATYGCQPLDGATLGDDDDDDDDADRPASPARGGSPDEGPPSFKPPSPSSAPSLTPPPPYHPAGPTAKPTTPGGGPVPRRWPTPSPTEAPASYSYSYDTPLLISAERPQGAQERAPPPVAAAAAR